MSPSLPTTPSALLIAVPPPLDLAAVKGCTADAIVLSSGGDASPLRVIVATRPDVPVIVLEDADEARTLALIALGAEQVLPVAAAIPEVAKAVRMAVARRQGGAARARRTGTPETPDTTQGAVSFPNAPHLQAIARLAGGIAHEFNNLLTVVEAAVEHLQQQLPDAGADRDATDQISAATKQATTLTRQLLAFGRQQTLLPASVDVNGIVSDASPSLRQQLGEPVRVTTELTRELPLVRVDREQLIEVLSNLAAAAQDTMPDGGTLQIATDLFVATDDARLDRPWLPAGRFVRLRVSDSGLGLEEGVLPYLFEPFATPGPTARGRGLAMSSVYGVVKQSGGYIWADSRPNRGTSVTILLPPIETAVAAPRPEKAEKVARQAVRVLLVEDTDAVRQTLTSMLEWHGFSVTSASNAEEALEFVGTLRFDLLLTDVALPGQSGPEFAATFRGLSPGTPVIFMSGYSANAIDPRDLDTPRAFLQKPFQIQVLVDRINEVVAWARERGQSGASDSRA